MDIGSRTASAVHVPIFSHVVVDDGDDVGGDSSEVGGHAGPELGESSSSGRDQDQMSVAKFVRISRRYHLIECYSIRNRPPVL